MTVSTNPVISGISNVRVPYILAQSGVPVILAPNGTVATNGTVTLGTALPTIYTGGIWLRLPANAVGGGTSTAGLYWTVMSSTTVGVVTTTFADAATAFTPYVPTGAVTAVGSNAAYTQTTAADITLANITVPGGAMGVYGCTRSSVKWGINNTAGAKQGKSNFGGNLAQTTGSLTTSVGRHELLTVQNRGSLALQTAGSDNSGVGTAFSASNRAFAVNTASDQAITFTGQLTVATDYIMLDAFIVEVLPS